MSSFGPPSMVVDVNEFGRAEFECMAAGPPEPTFVVEKKEAVPGQWLYIKIKLLMPKG